MPSVRVVLTGSRKKPRYFADLIVWWDKYRHESKKPLSHVSFKWSAKSWERDLFYQAQGHATIFSGGTLFYKQHEVIEEYELNLPKEVEVKIGQSCVDREGIPYAVKQTVGIGISGLVYILSFRKLDIDNIFADGSSTVNCLEEVARILIQDAGATPFPGSLDKATPWQFRQWLREQPFAKEVVGGIATKSQD
jgi:hypothetical protein